MWSPGAAHSPVPAAQSGKTGLCAGGIGTWQNDSMTVWNTGKLIGRVYRSRDILRHELHRSPGDNDQVMRVGHASVGVCH